jgi:hypothetical protein
LAWVFLFFQVASIVCWIILCLLFHSVMSTVSVISFSSVSACSSRFVQCLSQKFLRHNSICVWQWILIFSHSCNRVVSKTGTQSVIYLIECQKCKSQYVGQT